jgi:hypothetical protein
MPNSDDKLRLLPLTDKEKSALPLGYNRIYVKAISPKEVEIAVTVYSKKYRKADLLALAPEKPISKIMAWREEKQ